MKKIKVKMNKQIYLGFSILELSKIRMYKFWYEYIKPKHGKAGQSYAIWILTVL